MIAVIGTRGFPDVQGGVERHCEELYPRLAAQGFEIVVFTRSPYVAGPRWSSWRGVRLRKVWTPRRQSLEAIWHSLAALVLARASGATVVHVHAIGPGLVVPLARALGLKVVFTHHGRDYMRDKWGPLAKRILRLGERAALRSAHEVLAVSREVEAWITQELGRTAAYVPNGVAVAPRAPVEVERTLAAFQLAPQAYAIAVARLVPEKGLHDLIDAIAALDAVPALVVVGDADHRSAYATQLQARAPAKVRFVGVQAHERTLDLVRGASAFVLPSYHEGLPIALLEALACGTPAVASDIAPNREIIGDRDNGWLVPAGDVGALRVAVRQACGLDAGDRQALAARTARLVDERFSWKRTADQVAAVYRQLGE